MKRLIVGILCAAMLLTAFAAPAVAADDNSDVTVNLQSDQPVQYWRITMAAIVVANTGTDMVVSLANPDNMATEEGDQTSHLQIIPITDETTYTDQEGEPIAANAVITGQEVRVTFRYHFLDSSPRMTQMDQCLTVQLAGDTQTATSHAAVDSIRDGQLVATVVSVDDRKMQVYVEAGRVSNGDTEYMVQGLQTFTVPAGATILGPNGGALQITSVKPFQRVVLRASDFSWAESMPPQLALQEVDKVEVLYTGEKIFRASALASLNRMTATVKSVRSTSSGTVYTVEPVEGSRESALAETFTVSAPALAETDEEQSAVLSAVKAGTVVEIHYAGLEYGEDVQTPRIAWAHSFEIVE